MVQYDQAKLAGPFHEGITHVAQMITEAMIGRLGLRTLGLSEGELPVMGHQLLFGGGLPGLSPAVLLTAPVQGAAAVAFRSIATPDETLKKLGPAEAVRAPVRLLRFALCEWGADPKGSDAIWLPQGRRVAIAAPDMPAYVMAGHAVGLEADTADLAKMVRDVQSKEGKTSVAVLTQEEQDILVRTAARVGEHVDIAASSRASWQLYRKGQHDWRRKRHPRKERLK